jgi:hypothetical protein
MANNIVKDSLNPIDVKQVQVPQGTAIGTLILTAGVKIGVSGDTPRKGEDGNYYTTVDTAALVQFTGVTGTWTDGAPVYATGAGAISATATGNTLIGYADRPKSATAAGPLYVQLVPRAV